MEVWATAKGTGISPRKIRLVADMVRGKGVEEALALLRFTTTPVARVVAKAVRSAQANAENNYQLNPARLSIAQIFAGDAPRLRRFRPQARGRFSPILKRSSHITVVVEGKSGE